MNYKQRTLLLIAITAGIKMILGSVVELNNDEAHYWLYAHRLQWSYFDHPPMIAVFIKLFTLNNLFHHEFFLRLPGVVTAAANTWLVFLIGRQLKDELAGWIAALLFTASIYASVIAGLFILPDTPQLFFWLLSVRTLMNVIQRDHQGRPVAAQLLLAGLWIGFCVISKVHGIFLWPGFVAFLLFNRRSLLRNPYLYVGMLVTGALMIPPALWTMHNEFSTYHYHSSRIHFGRLQSDSFFRELFGEIAYHNPVVWFLTVAALLRQQDEDLRSTLLRWLALPLIGTVLVLSLFNDTLPHWSGPAYVTLIPFTAAWLRTLSITSPWRKSVKVAVWITAVGLVICLSIIQLYPGTIGSGQQTELGKNDVTLDMSGWRQFTDSLRRHIEDGPRPARIISGYWFPGGHLAYYAGTSLNVPVSAVGKLSDIHHFAWTNPDLPPLVPGSDAWYVTISNFYAAPPPALRGYFRECTLLYTVPQIRSGKAARNFFVYRLAGYLGGMPPSGVMTTDQLPASPMP